MVRVVWCRLSSVVLRVAEQQDVVGMNGIAWREVGKPPLHPDLIALKNSGVTLDRLHERACFPLLGSAPLAKAATAQAVPKLIDRPLRGRRKVVSGMIARVQRQIGLDPLETRDDPGQVTYVLAETRDRGPRRNG